MVCVNFHRMDLEANLEYEANYMKDETTLAVTKSKTLRVRPWSGFADYYNTSRCSRPGPSSTVRE